MPNRDDKGRFTSGNKGRPKGTQNKAKKGVEEAVLEIVEGNLDKVMRDLKKLSPRDRVRAITDLLKYVLPAKRAIDSTVHIDGLSEDQANRILEEILAKLELNGQ